MDQATELTPPFQESHTPVWKNLTTLNEKLGQASSQKFRGLERIDRFVHAIPDYIPSKTTVGFLMAMAGVTLFSQDQAASLQSDVIPIDSRKVEIIDTRVRVDDPASIEAKLFPNYNPEELKTAKARVKEQIDHYQSLRKIPVKGEEIYQERINNTLKWQSVMEKVVQDPRLNIAPAERDYWIKFVLATVYLESGGDRLANPGKTEEQKDFNGKGLGQLRQIVAEKDAQKLGMEKFDIFNPEDNLLLTTYELLRLRDLFGGNMDLATTAYFMGERSVARAIYRHSISDLKKPVGQVDHDFSTPTAIPATATYGKDKRLNAVSLWTPAVIAELKSQKLWDDHAIVYTDRQKAAQCILFNEGKID